MSLLHGKTILIVDDEEALRDALEFEFEMIGCQVQKASGGTKALEILQSGTPIDIILSDIRMPSGDGINLLKNVRALDPKLPIVAMITGFSDLPDSQFIECGAVSVFHKPIRVEEIIHALEKAIKELAPI